MAKFIARKNFRNNCGIEVKDAIHELHVHKGAIFELGCDVRGNPLPIEKFKEMAKADQNLIAQLNAAECLADATNEKAVKAIQAEVVAEKKSADAEKASTMAAGSNADVVSQLITQLKALVAASPKS